MKNIIPFALALAVILAGSARAQTYDTNNDVVGTFAGFGFPAYIDGTGRFSAFSSPGQIVSDTSSNLYVWDSGNNRIRKITPGAVVTTFAGGGNTVEGYGTNVSLSWGTVSALVMDHANKMWLLMTPAYYGSGSWLVNIGTNGYASIANGDLTNLGSSSGLCFDSANNLYYTGGNRIYRYNPASQVVQAFAGNGVAANFDGQGPVFSAFNNPTTLACDQADNLYVWDSGNGTIRRIDQSENVSTIAGSGVSYYSADGVGMNASFSGINAMFADGYGNIYFACNGCVRKMDPQTNVVTLAGTFNQYGGSFSDGPGATATFNDASGGCFSQGIVFVADAGNNRIRDITFNAQPAMVAPANLQLQTYPGVQINGTIGRTYQIQSSPNLSSWNTVATVLLTSSPFLWIDSSPANGRQFYRAVMLP
jgi:hypothetical protein